MGFLLLFYDERGRDVVVKREAMAAKKGRHVGLPVLNIFFWGSRVGASLE